MANWIESITPIVIPVSFVLVLISCQNEINNDTSKVLWPLAVSLLTIFLTSYLNSRAKLKEIKLSNYYRDRIDAVKILYGLFMDLNYIHITIFGEKDKGWGHNVYKQNLREWLVSFKKLSVFYAKNRILLLEESELSSKVRENLRQLSQLKRAVRTEFQALTDIEDEFEGHIEY